MPSEKVGRNWNFSNVTLFEIIYGEKGMNFDQ